MDGLAKLGWVGRVGESAFENARHGNSLTAGLIFPTIYISVVETYRLFA